MNIREQKKNDSASKADNQQKNINSFKNLSSKNSGARGFNLTKEKVQRYKYMFQKENEDYNNSPTNSPKKSPSKDNSKKNESDTSKKTSQAVSSNIPKSPSNKSNINSSTLVSSKEQNNSNKVIQIKGGSDTKEKKTFTDLAFSKQSKQDDSSSQGSSDKFSLSVKKNNEDAKSEKEKDKYKSKDHSTNTNTSTTQMIKNKKLDPVEQEKIYSKSPVNKHHTGHRHHHHRKEAEENKEEKEYSIKILQTDTNLEKEKIRDDSRSEYDKDEKQSDIKKYKKIKNKNQSCLLSPINEELVIPDTPSPSLVCNNQNGLPNLGNTCFMNTCLQNLIHCPPFIKRLVNTKDQIFSNKPRTKKISQIFFSLCASQAKDNINSSNIQNFKSTFSKKHIEYSGYRQHDTQEFCRLLLEDISKELNTVVTIPPYKELDDKGKTKKQLNTEFDILFRKREDSIIVDTFYGQFVNIFTCKCKFQSFSFEKFLDIPILLDTKYENQNLKDLLKCNFEKDEIEWGSKCPKCNKKTIHVKEIKLAYLPEVLIFSLQRSNGRSSNKNLAQIKFFEEINLDDYVDKECVGKVNSKYSLIGIGNHSGSINFGHYFSYNKLGSKWYEFNDSSVSEEEIKFSSTTAYVLFYQRKDTL